MVNPYHFAKLQIRAITYAEWTRFTVIYFSAHAYTGCCGEVEIASESGKENFDRDSVTY